MNENHIRAQYRLYNHKGYWSRIGSMDYVSHRYEDKLLFGEDEILKYARTYDGKRNLFISRAARIKDGSIHHCNIVSFDVDPIRPKETASNEEQHLNALTAGHKILALYPGGYLASSGNGALVCYRVPDINDYVLHYAREKIIIAELQKLVEGLNVKIDATNYIEAITKIIGTFSTKGERTLFRQARWIDYPFPPYRNCPKLLQRFNEIDVEEQEVNPISLPQIHDGDRSVADFHLVNFIKKNGAGPAAALAALKSSPYGRQNDTKDQERLIKKVYGNIKSEENVKKGYFYMLFEPYSETGDAITTGIGSLDSALGSLPKGEITTLAARSGYGKSSFACTVSEHLRKRGKKVLYFSTEMEQTYIMHKFVAIVCGVSLTNTIKKVFTEEETKRIRAYEQELLLSPINIVDEFQPTIQLLRTKVIEYKPDIIIFDHITQVGTHWEHVAQFMRELKVLTTEEQCVTIVLSQLNEPGRQKDGTEAISIRGDVRGSQEIIFLSSIFMFISNPYIVKTDIQPVEIHIAKNRYGISDLTVPLTVNKQTGKYGE